MAHRIIQRTYKNGDLSIDFDLSFDGQKLIAEHIQIHANFNSGIPEDVTLEFYKEKWRLVQTTFQGANISEKKYFNSEISNDIVSEIQKVIVQETPHFTS